MLLNELQTSLKGYGIDGIIKNYPKNIRCGYQRGGLYHFSYIPGMMLKKLKSEIWIVTEREDEARDNGFCFLIM